MFSCGRLDRQAKRRVVQAGGEGGGIILAALAPARRRRRLVLKAKVAHVTLTRPRAKTARAHEQRVPLTKPTNERTNERTERPSCETEASPSLPPGWLVHVCMHAAFAPRTTLFVRYHFALASLANSISLARRKKLPFSDNNIEVGRSFDGRRSTHSKSKT